MSEALDRRLHPVRPDLAAKAYEGRVTSARFVEGELNSIVADILDMRAEPRPDIGVDTQLLFGEQVRVFEETPEGWAWGQLESDGYVGWFSSDGIASPGSPTHRVRALRTYRYPGPDLKLPPLGQISLASRVEVTGMAVTRGLEYALLSDGSAVVAKHLWSLERQADDWVAIAEELIGTPYLWGGRSSLGLDCSALVQIAASFGGHVLQRDSDMQEASAGDEISDAELSGLRRGDLIFWKGHVGIVAGPGRLLHANGHTMTVANEDLEEAVKRIAETEWGEITCIRRLSSAV